MSDAILLREIGQAIFGSRWQTDLGNALSVNNRTVRRWIKGEEHPRPGVWTDLERLLDEREIEHQRVRNLLNERKTARRAFSC